MKEALKQSLVKKEPVQKNDDNDSEESEELDTAVEIEKSIMPSISNFVEKLDNELLKAF